MVVVVGIEAAGFAAGVADGGADDAAGVQAAVDGVVGAAPTTVGRAPCALQAKHAAPVCAIPRARPCARAILARCAAAILAVVIDVVLAKRAVPPTGAAPLARRCPVASLRHRACLRVLYCPRWHRKPRLIVLKSSG